MASLRPGEQDDPEQSQEGGGREGIGSEVFQSFHHDGKNCLTTRVPNKHSWEADLGPTEGVVVKVPPGCDSIRLGAERWGNLDLLRPQICPKEGVS